MSRRRLQCLVTSCLLLSVFGILPAPQNVRMNSVNFKNILQWDPPNVHKENVTYAAQYISNIGSHNSMCTNIVSTECDFSSLLIYGNYTLMVGAESCNEKSNFVNLSFSPMDDTIVGPPTVKVVSRSDSLYVDVSGPFTTHERFPWELKHYYGSWMYRMFYWKKGFEEKISAVNFIYNSETLPDLEPWTTYCLHVQAVIPEWNNKMGELRQVFCEQTTDNGITPVRVVVAVLLVSMLVVLMFTVFCFFACLYIYRQIKYVVFPAYSLPQHFKEYLSKPFYSSQFLSSQSHEEDDSYDKLTVLSEESENCSYKTSHQFSNAKQQQQQQGIREEVSGTEKV
uniref:Tissue factor n=1 Tax=Sphenodon punctatus TaxID=8508 RepID=A0A8D0L8Y5_SPHPU